MPKIKNWTKVRKDVWENDKTSHRVAVKETPMGIYEVHVPDGVLSEHERIEMARDRATNWMDDHSVY